MQQWVERARACQWQDWDYEETIKTKLLFLRYLGTCFAKSGEEEAVRLAEQLESYGGVEQATVFASVRSMPAPQAAFCNAVLNAEAPLVYPVVLAAIEAQNKGGQELIASLIAGLEATYRLGQHPQAELLGALLGAAHAYELDEDGWQVLLGLVLARYSSGEQVPQSGLARGALAQELVVSAAMACEEWSATVAIRMELPEEWLSALERTSDKPGMKLFLLALEVNADAVVAEFRTLATGRIPAHHLEYYIDAVMGLEDVCCLPQFFRK
ncbi:MmgE/PrpD family protein [Tumebacillus permanentifrigoris]|uniref:MmgE/PrpD family protein n=1 Tax=Tumebacillus permanentifrigoris TaxID=378543 RepID=A0A316DBK5_9BACL|nr:MmgE/PrpD family protein [Tumebacillus permanentifrigoris]PWK14370.1 MmgE/PrpD family protein [Tumebacillus permanentifrigoris]